MSEPGTTQSPRTEEAARCPKCGAPFLCNPGPDCWCMKVPFRPMPADAAACLCPACLAADPG